MSLAARKYTYIHLQHHWHHPHPHPHRHHHHTFNAAEKTHVSIHIQIRME